jgi:hypothetical protein
VPPAPRSAWAIPLLAMLAACATVPRAAPELSVELTGRIQATRTAHVALVRLYMDEKRATVDRFVMNEWAPRFASEAFQNPAVAEAWRDVVNSRDDAERTDFIVGLGPRLQRQINEKRLELMQPLDEVERTIVRRIEDNYNEMLAMNATLTGLLEAGAEATETQARLVRRLDAEQKLPQYLEQADEIVSLLVGKVDAFEANRARIEALLRQLQALK